MTPPLLVGSSAARDLEGVAADARALPAEVALLEVRLDRFADPLHQDLAALCAAAGRPAILTLRSAREGGGFNGSPADAAQAAQRGDAAGFAWIDLEEPVAAQVPRGKARRIVSWHAPGPLADPDAAAARVRALAALDADVIKVAAELTDPAAALRFVRNAATAGAALNRPVVAIAMGQTGRWLRPLAGLFGMPLLYAAIHAARRTAAGQWTVAEALALHRAVHINPATRVYAVAGADVSASLSPAAHNHVFAALGEDRVYVAIDAADFAHVAEVARALPLHGLSVTAPHKAAALAAADEAGAAASAIGAANTLVRDAAGRLVADNTDAAGFLAAVELALADPDAARAVCIGHSLDPLERLDGTQALETDRRLGLRSALVYGTGGAARAIAFGLRRRGVRVAVTGRDQGAAAALVLAVGHGLEAVSEGRASSQSYDLLVKAVPDLPDRELPLDPFDFPPSGLAADVVYRPLETDFLLASRRRGRVPVPGLLMFSEQAVLQSARFLGRAAGELRPHVAEGIAAALGSCAALGS